ncbi:MAG TPA: DUF6600 domain-containing protein [Mucilaginibacter sp.]|nr:DUF6600 domain-containing protein [Mucilaginibacter sp.]
MTIIKKFRVFVVAASLSLAGCAAFMQPTVYQGPPRPYTGDEPSNPSSSPDYNAPQPEVNPAYPNSYSSDQTLQIFYDELSPFGRWVDYPSYGYVWSPDVGTDFDPYVTNGYWVYSDYGWTWASGYTWGWATFHYGRWFFDDYYGWLWVPGDEWAPAWVTWGQSGDYLCWAPLAPGVSMREALLGWWTPPADSWNVVPVERFTRPDIHNYVVINNRTVINNVQIINNGNNASYYRNDRRNSGNNTIYNLGPRLHDVEKGTRSPINPVKIKDNTRPGAQTVNNQQLLTYRPFISKNRQPGSNNPAPQHVQRYQGGPDMIKAPRPHNQQNTQPGSNPNQQPQRKPDYQPGNQQNPQQNPNPGQQPQHRPDYQPGNQQNPQQGSNPNQQPQRKPDFQPGNQQNPQQNSNPNQQPHRPDYQPGNQQNPQQGSNPNQQPQRKPDYQPGNQQNPQQGSNSNQQPQRKPDYQPGNQQNPQQGSNSNQQPQRKPDFQPGNQQNPQQGSNPNQQPQRNPRQGSNQNPAARRIIIPRGANGKPGQNKSPDTTRRRKPANQ